MHHILFREQSSYKIDFLFTNVCINLPMISANFINFRYAAYDKLFVSSSRLLIKNKLTELDFLPTPVCCRFHVSAQPSPSAVLALQHAARTVWNSLFQHSLFFFCVGYILSHLLSSKPTASPSGSTKCLRFGD